MPQCLHHCALYFLNHVSNSAKKSIDKLNRELGSLRGRVSNPKFAESAPQTIVEETRANLALREAEEGQLRAALARLSELE